ncbi:metallophosphoesterase [Nesterenkonia lutea]|uniref:MPP superfamily phosphohydrolase n=1 Tax=Nesterenkonia lutea TaxID=272919 RepID=A0ABR9JAM5_9MICC|nr:metallophosphoesterase [Nesterenkonia lutea]MBE1522976.1 putative MPP superfamily phosphohydrolase [Nesterenkonia lutea]
MNASSAEEQTPRRRRRRRDRFRSWFLGLGAVLTVLGLLAGVYGVVVEPRVILEEKRIEARLPGLGPDWDGAEVIVFSDLQVGMWWDNTAMIERAVEQTVNAEPEAVLLAGDFVYGSDADVRERVADVARLLEPLTGAGIPVYAVMGNHDYAVGAVETLTGAFEDQGIEVLANEATEIPAPDSRSGPGLHVVGIGPSSVGEADPLQALELVPEEAPRLVLMHNPTTFPHLPAHSAPMTVAGHTHCGQIALPGSPEWSYLGLTKEEEIVADGFAPAGYGEAGNELFVTCGIGFSVLPVRINAPPQLVTIELRPA